MVESVDNHDDVLLIVGNGLSIDLNHAVAPALDEWDTRSPLAWNVTAPDTGSAFVHGTPLLDVFPETARALKLARKKLSTSSDFDYIIEAVRIARRSFNRHDALAAVVGLRHVTALSFAQYQYAVDTVDRSAWPLGNYLIDLAVSGRVIGALSLNYDLNLETLFADAGLTISDLSVAASGVGNIPLGKPHGSIDYYPDRFMSFGPNAKPTYPMSIVADGVDTPLIKRLPRSELVSVRVVADLVLPSEKSGISRNQWVQPISRFVETYGPSVQTLMIIGVSYSEADRKELDTIFSRVNPNATAVVYDPCPSAGLLESLKTHFRTTELWGTELYPLYEYLPFPRGSQSPGSKRRWWLSNTPQSD